MRILNSGRIVLEKLIERLYSLGQRYGEMKKIRDSRREKLISSVKLTDVQISDINQLFVCHYGKKVPYDWHRLYQSFTGKFQAKYFPEILFSTKFEPKVNPRAYRYVLDDKILLPVFCNGEESVRIPYTYATFCNGVYFNAANQTMTKDQLAEYLKDMGYLLIKPTQDTSSGRGVRIISCEGGYDLLANESIIDILTTYSVSSFCFEYER